MIYTLFHNQDAFWIRPGTPEDTYVMGYTGQIRDPDQGSIKAMLERIFIRHNRDDRPDGQSRPSLSVGDVVVLAPDELVAGEPWAFTVDIVGFKEWSG